MFLKQIISREPFLCLNASPITTKQQKEKCYFGLKVIFTETIADIFSDDVHSVHKQSPNTHPQWHTLQLFPKKHYNDFIKKAKKTMSEVYIAVLGTVQAADLRFLSLFFNN